MLMVVHYTHDNFFRPYRVEVNTKSKTFTVIKNTAAKENHWTNAFVKPVIVDATYTKVFIGKDPKYKKFATGNSILFCIDDTKHIYVYVGHKVVAFETTDKIDKYESIIGNNDVSYPAAFSKDYAYFLLDNVYSPNKFEHDGKSHNYRSMGDAYYYLFYELNRGGKKFPCEIIDSRR